MTLSIVQLPLGPLQTNCYLMACTTTGQAAVVDPADDGVVFDGDVLFQGSIGRTDLPGGDFDLLMTSIRDKLLPLPDETVVLSGHGPATTIGDERRYNPFLQED